MPSPMLNSSPPFVFGNVAANEAGSLALHCLLHNRFLEYILRFFERDN